MDRDFAQRAATKYFACFSRRWRRGGCLVPCTAARTCQGWQHTIFRKLLADLRLASLLGGPIGGCGAFVSEDSFEAKLIAVAVE